MYIKFVSLLNSYLVYTWVMLHLFSLITCQHLSDVTESHVMFSLCLFSHLPPENDTCLFLWRLHVGPLLCWLQSLWSFGRLSTCHSKFTIRGSWICKIAQESIAPRSNPDYLDSTTGLHFEQLKTFLQSCKASLIAHHELFRKHLEKSNEPELRAPR